MSDKAQLIVEGKKLAVSNLNKVLYPKVGFTKGQVIDYYIRIAPVLLPHLKDRPLTMKRYPNGVDAEFFYEKNCPPHRPKWVKTAKVWSEGNNRMMNYCLAQDLPTLVWAANLADLELHTSLARKKNVARPTMMVSDNQTAAIAYVYIRNRVYVADTDIQKCMHRLTFHSKLCIHSQSRDRHSLSVMAVECDCVD